jgi:hypothetical protein
MAWIEKNRWFVGLLVAVGILCYAASSAPKAHSATADSPLRVTLTAHDKAWFTAPPGSNLKLRMNLSVSYADGYSARAKVYMRVWNIPADLRYSLHNGSGESVRKAGAHVVVWTATHLWSTGYYDADESLAFTLNAPAGHDFSITFWARRIMRDGTLGPPSPKITQIWGTA